MSTPTTDAGQWATRADYLDDPVPWSEKSNEWHKGFSTGCEEAREGKTLAGYDLDPSNERHRGIVMGWRVADSERATPMGHTFDESIWGKADYLVEPS